jgi:AcrR family transcriptional regulator
MSKDPYHHGDLKTAILDAAEEMIASEPIEMISMRALARKAGVSPGAPYHHFEDRSALILGLCQRGFQRLFDKLSKDTSVPDLSQLIVGYMAFVDENPALYQLMFSPEATIGDHKDALHPFARPVSELLDASLLATNANLSEDQQREVAAAIWCFMHGVVTLGMATPLKVRLDETSLQEFAARSVRKLITPAEDGRKEQHEHVAEVS